MVGIVGVLFSIEWTGRHGQHTLILSYHRWQKEGDLWIDVKYLFDFKIQHRNLLSIFFNFKILDSHMYLCRQTKDPNPDAKQTKAFGGRSNKYVVALSRRVTR